MYPSLDRTTSYHLQYSLTFDVPKLMAMLSPYHQEYEVRVQSFTGSVWKINLEICYRLLSQLATVFRGRPFRLQEMVNVKRGLLAAWVDCIRPTEPNLTKFVSRPKRGLTSSLKLTHMNRNVSTSTRTCRPETCIV